MGRPVDCFAGTILNKQSKVSVVTNAKAGDNLNFDALPFVNAATTTGFAFSTGANFVVYTLDFYVANQSPGTSTKQCQNNSSEQSREKGQT